MVGEKEIIWEKVSRYRFRQLLDCSVKRVSLKISGLSFKTHALKINIAYDNLDFEALLKEKFFISDAFMDVPTLHFVKYDPDFGFKLPYKHYGYISEENEDVIVFASSFGVFKSVISGYASFFTAKDGYVPVHGGVIAVNGRGLILAGGTSAGKTTSILRLVDSLRRDIDDIKILTDDWAILKKEGSAYVVKTFDPSISLRENNLIENPHMRFHNHDDLVKSIREKVKVSIEPDKLYGSMMMTNVVHLNSVVLLRPEAGPNKLQIIEKSSFASEIIDTAYHYPYIYDSQIKEHQFFWENVANDLQVFSFSTRNSNGGFQNLDAIRRLL